MTDHEPCDPCGRLYGTQEAAELLGIHRSTLHLAVRKHLLPADAVTPGGHLRFRRATLEIFRERLRSEPATTEADSALHAHVLVRIAHALAGRAELENMFQETLSHLCDARLGIAMACIGIRTAAFPRIDKPRLVAIRGYPDWFLPEYERVRPDAEQAAIRAQRLHEVVVRADTHDPHLQTDAVVRLLRRADVRSYVAAPIVNERDVLGVLVAASKTPRRFGASELLLLRGVADELALALRALKIAQTQETEQLGHYLTLSQRLTQRALELRAGGPHHGSGSASRVSPADLADLGRLFQREVGAYEVCALGFDRSLDLRATYPALPLLACQACAGDALVSEQWTENGTVHTALAASVRMASGDRAGVAVMWKRSYPAGEAEHALLVAFAGAFALATSPREPPAPYALTQA